MSKWLAIAETAEEDTHIPPDNKTIPDKTPSHQREAVFCQVKSERQVVNVKKSTDDMRHGFAVSRNPKTWTGNVISMSNWQRLTDWQKHGPNGRIWCGECRAWITQCEHTKGGEA